MFCKTTAYFSWSAGISGILLFSGTLFLIAAENADFVFAYGPNSGRIISGTITGGMPETRGRAFTNREELVAALKRTAKPGDVLLFKAKSEAKRS